MLEERPVTCVPAEVEAALPPSGGDPPGAPMYSAVKIGGKSS